MKLGADTVGVGVLFSAVGISVTGGDPWHARSVAVCGRITSRTQAASSGGGTGQPVGDLGERPIPVSIR
jgi:hypothetical protein